MKKKVLLVAGVVGASLLALSGAAVFAANDGKWSPFMQVSDSIVIKKDEVRDGSLYLIANKDITIDGEVNGDVYCAAGQSVTITGKVHGDVNCAAASKASIHGEVEDVHIATSKASVDAKVHGDLSMLALEAAVSKDTVVDGDMNGASQKLEMNGMIAKNMHMSADSMQINGVVSGEGNIMTEELIFGSNGKIKGDLYYGSPKEHVLDKASVGGTISYNEMQVKEQGPNLAFIATSMLAMFLFALVVALIMPQFVHGAFKYSIKNMAITSLIGFVVAFLTPVAVLLLAFSYVGAPLAITLLFAWLTVMMLSGSFAAYAFGSWLVRSSHNVLARMAVGSVAVLALYLIPLVQVFAILAAGIIGSGMIVRGVTQDYKKPNYTLPAETTKKSETTTKKTTKK